MPSTPIDSSKRVAVITGCSEITSLGAAFALDLLSRGWTVFATARDDATLSVLSGKGCRTLRLDVTSEESVASAAQTVSTLTGGRVDLLINNAGVYGIAPLLHTDPAKLAMMHDIHVVAPLRLTQAFYPYLREAARVSGHRSKIVNIGSVLAFGAPWLGAYGSTKAGEQVLSDVLRRELAPAGIDVITVELALVRTAMSAGNKDFPLSLKDIDATYDATPALDAQSKQMEKNSGGAPSAASVARSIIDAAEQKKSPGKLWVGKDSLAFRFVFPYLSVWLSDFLIHKLFGVGLVKVT